MSRGTHWAALIVASAAFLARADDKSPAASDASNPLAQLQQQFMMQFDVNRDGKLSGREQMMAQEAMRRQGINLGIAPGGFPGADQFQKMFDRDGDGKLNAEEKAAAQAELKKDKEKPDDAKKEKDKK